MALDEYEKGFTSARLDEVFSQVCPRLILVLYQSCAHFSVCSAIQWLRWCCRSICAHHMHQAMATLVDNDQLSIAMVVVRYKS